MVRVKPFGVISLRRLLLGGGALAAAVLTLGLTLRSVPPGWDGPWPDETGLVTVFAGDPTAVVTPRPPGAPAEFGLVTIVVVPVAPSRAATLYRDGLEAGRFDGGPLTLAVRGGDVLAVHLGAGSLPAQVRVLAASPAVAAPRVGAWGIGSGGDLTLPEVRLNASGSPR